jgi:carbonic anhydrase
VRRALHVLSIALLLLLGASVSADDPRQDVHRRALRARHGLEVSTAKVAGIESEVLDADDAWQALLAGNQRHVLGTPRAAWSGGERSAGARHAQPNALVLDCSDDSTDPATLFDQPASALLVLREPGNLASATTIASIEHAIAARGTALVVVLGHEGCTHIADAAGGVPAASSSLAAVQERLAPVLQPLAQAGLRNAALVHRAVHDNVHRSAAQLVTASPIVAEAVRAGRLRIVEAVHDPAQGAVKERAAPRTRAVFASSTSAAPANAEPPTNAEPPSPKEHTHD